MTDRDDQSRRDEPGLYDSYGRFVPERLIKPVDRLRHDVVHVIAERAIQASVMLGVAKADIGRDLDAFLELSAERYGVTPRGVKGKGNLTLTSYDGRFKVTRQIQDRLTFDERLQTAKALIDECIQTWTVGSGDEIRALIEHAFQVDKAGKISTERVLGLRKLKIEDETWARAMDAINDSVHVASSTSYIRVYERDDETGQYVAIPLNFTDL